MEGGVRAHAKSVCFFLASFLCFLFFGTVGLPAQKKDKQDLCLPSKYDRYRPINLLFEKLFCQFLVYHIFMVKVEMINRCKYVMLTDRSTIPPLAKQVLQLLMDQSGGSLPLTGAL